MGDGTALGVERPWPAAKAWGVIEMGLMVGMIFPREQRAED